MRNKILSALIVLGMPMGVLFYSQLSLAQEKNLRRLKIKFDDEKVLGNAENTDVINTQTMKQFNYKKMIKLRDNFIPQAESDGAIFEK